MLYVCVTLLVTSVCANRVLYVQDHNPYLCTSGIDALVYSPKFESQKRRGSQFRVRRHNPKCHSISLDNLPLSPL
jgi:hypothetical protein